MITDRNHKIQEPSMRFRRGVLEALRSNTHILLCNYMLRTTSPDILKPFDIIVTPRNLGSSDAPSTLRIPQSFVTLTLLPCLPCGGQSHKAKKCHLQVIGKST